VRVPIAACLLVEEACCKAGCCSRGHVEELRSAFNIGCALLAGVPDQSWDESAPAGTGFGQDAPAAPAADEWGAAPAAGAAGQQFIYYPAQ